MVLITDFLVVYDDSLVHLRRKRAHKIFEQLFEKINLKFSVKFISWELAESIICEKELTTGSIIDEKELTLQEELP